MYSVMTLLPDSDSGFVVLMNGEADEARTVINEGLLKHFTAPQENHTVAGYAARLAHQPATADGAPVPDTSARTPAAAAEIGSAACRERGCPYGSFSEFAEASKKKNR